MSTAFRRPPAPSIVCNFTAGIEDVVSHKLGPDHGQAIVLFLFVPTARGLASLAPALKKLSESVHQVRRMTISRSVEGRKSSRSVRTPQHPFSNMACVPVRQAYIMGDCDVPVSPHVTNDTRFIIYQADTIYVQIGQKSTSIMLGSRPPGSISKMPALQATLSPFYSVSPVDDDSIDPADRHRLPSRRRRSRRQIIGTGTEIARAMAARDDRSRRPRSEAARQDSMQIARRTSRRFPTVPIVVFDRPRGQGR